MSAPDEAGAMDIADVQSSVDTRRIPIDKVGIKDLRHSVRIAQRDGGDQHTVAMISMYVNLPHHFKGTHMSRFVELLNAHDAGLTVDNFVALLPAMTDILEAEAGHIEMGFTYFMQKAAPVTGVESLMDYDIHFIGESIEGRTAMTVRVGVPVTSLCPCSKQISAYGAHNQRSQVTVTARLKEFLWVEELIELVEAQASCELYGLLKRPDEKYVTERAYENPKFVEDLVRDVAHQLDTDERIAAYVVEAENFESIHNHSAYARIERDMPR